MPSTTNSPACWAEKYYKRVSARRLDKVDPQLLYLGSRPHGTPKSHLEGSHARRKYRDIVSINYYSRWSPGRQDL